MARDGSSKANETPSKVRGTRSNAAASGASSVIQTETADASEAPSKVRGSKSKAAGTLRAEVSEASSKARGSRSKAGSRATGSEASSNFRGGSSDVASTVRAKGSGGSETWMASTTGPAASEVSGKARGGSSEVSMTRAEAADASNKVQAGSSEPFAAASSNLESTDSSPENPDKHRMSRRFSASDPALVTATVPPNEDGARNVREGWTESPGPVVPAVSQTPPLTKVRPRSAGGSRRPSGSSSSGQLMHNTPQATRTANRSESAADLNSVPRGGGLGAVRARRQAF